MSKKNKKSKKNKVVNIDIPTPPKDREVHLGGFSRHKRDKR